jgi:hypothetical protein
MTDTYSRGLIAAGAVGSVVTALITSGTPSEARKVVPRKVYNQTYHEGINANGTVVCDGQVVGKDPDRRIQSQLYWECGRSNGDGGGDE